MNRRRFLLAAGAGTAAAAAGCLSALDPRRPASIGDRDPTPLTDGSQAWPGDGFDPANTGYNPHVSLLASDIDSVRLTDGGAGIDTWEDGALAVAGDRLYYGTVAGDVVCCGSDGTRLWTYGAAPHGRVRSVPSVTREVVYVSSTNATHALATDDGEELWTRDASVFHGSSVVTDGNVYASGYGSGVVAMDVETGEIEWGSDSRPTAGLAVADGSVYTTGIGSDGGVVAAIESGTTEWVRSGLEDMHVVPVVTDDVVLVCLGDGRLIALDRTDGQTVWAHRRGSSPSTRPAVAHDQVYLPAGNGGRTHCLDIETGDELWTIRTGLYPNQPTAVADGVYFGTPNEGLFAVAPDGTVRWHHEDWRIESSMSAVGDRLYVIPYAGPMNSGDLHALTE